MKGHVRKRGKSWAIVVELGKDAEGKRRQKWHTFHGTKKDAEQELTRILHELNTGMYAEPDRLTVSTYLERWLEDYARVNVAPTTLKRYQDIVKNHLVPALGHLQLAKLRPLHIQQMESEMLVSGRKKGTGGLKARTVLHHHRVLHGALQQAVKWQLLPRNPADAVTPPRPEHSSVSVIEEHEAGRLLKLAEGTTLFVPVLLALSTGMRRGELLALRWQDVDLEAGTLAVRQAVSYTKGKVHYREPKTAKSRRSMALPASVVDVLKEHHKQQAEGRLSKGPVYRDQGLLCCREDGTAWHPDGFTCSWRKLCAKAGLKVRFHDLRHTHATQLLREGIHPKVVSERLGHSTIGLTLDVYSHVLPDMQKEAAAKTDETLQRIFAGASSA